MLRNFIVKGNVECPVAAWCQNHSFCCRDRPQVGYGNGERAAPGMEQGAR